MRSASPVIDAGPYRTVARVDFDEVRPAGPYLALTWWSASDKPWMGNCFVQSWGTYRWQSLARFVAKSAGMFLSALPFEFAMSNPEVQYAAIPTKNTYASCRDLLTDARWPTGQNDPLPDETKKLSDISGVLYYGR